MRKTGAVRLTALAKKPVRESKKILECDCRRESEVKEESLGVHSALEIF